MRPGKPEGDDPNDRVEDCRQSFRRPAERPAKDASSSIWRPEMSLGFRHPLRSRSSACFWWTTPDRPHHACALIRKSFEVRERRTRGRLAGDLDGSSIVVGSRHPDARCWTVSPCRRIPNPGEPFRSMPVIGSPGRGRRHQKRARAAGATTSSPRPPTARRSSRASETSCTLSRRAATRSSTSRRSTRPPRADPVTGEFSPHYLVPKAQAYSHASGTRAACRS